ncbi:MAG: antibiotic biosynthesis monooxygenase [Phycisphaeraceae bacterium]
MAHVMIRHRVQDFERWRQVFEAAADFRRDGGEQRYEVFEIHDDPDHVVLLFEWDSMERARAFLANPELSDAMDQAGVESPPEVWFLEQRTVGTL